MVPTDHPKILRARDSAISGQGQGEIADLIRAARENRPPAEIRQLIERLVPEYSGNLDGGEFEGADGGVRRRSAGQPESDGRRSAAVG